MKIELVEGNIMNHLRAIAGAFTSMAETKHILYRCFYPEEEIAAWFDPDKLEKILVNLLYNAFKFTQAGGEIQFKAVYYKNNDLPTGQYLEFSVMDNCPGIPAGSLQKIFDRFYQVAETVKPEGGSTGIGLSLTQDLVQLLHGEINVVSEYGKGSTFNVKLPLGKEHFKESEYLIVNSYSGTKVNSIHLSNGYLNSHNLRSKDINPKQAGKKPLLLLVEDNSDIRAQLYDNLSADYCIWEAIDGLLRKKPLKICLI